MAKKRLSFSLILRLAEIVLGAVFIASGIGKMTNAADFGELISNKNVALTSCKGSLLVFYPHDGDFLQSDYFSF